MPRKVRLGLIILGLILAGLVQAFPGYDRAREAAFHSFGDPYPKIVQQVFYYVEKKYVVPGRASPRKLLDGALRALENRYPEVLTNEDKNTNTIKVRVDEAERTFSISSNAQLDDAADTLNTILAFVTKNLSHDVREKDVYYLALNGALNALDPHSNVFDPKLYKEFMIGTRGTFGGIGFVFGIRDGEMTIITPIEGTPADRGGLRSGDHILYIDGEPTINMPVDIAANKMRGEPGTQVTLTLSREGWAEPKAITFTREIIHVESVESYVFDGDGGAPVLYAKVKHFQKDTTDELRKAVREAEASHPNLKGIILDLRNNPGGLLEQAIALSDGFLDEGIIVSTRGAEAGSTTREEAKRDKPISNKPLILLINQGSASASEIVSGALKANRALLIGQKTFGKASVQKLYQLTDGGALKLTVAQYLTPGDVSIQSIGIQPDIAVYPVRVAREKTRLGPPPEHMEEADLENAFTDWGNASEHPWAEVPFFDPTPEQEEQRSFAELSRAEKMERLAKDFGLTLARRLLGRAAATSPAKSRKELFRVAESVLKEVRAEESQKISREMERLGVDWSASPGGAPAQSLQAVGPKEVRAMGGTKAQLTFSVKNTGSTPAFQVWGRTDSSNPVFKNLDFPFGKVAPGQERRWTAEVEIPKSAVDRWDDVTLHLKQQGGGDAGTGKGFVRIFGVPQPAFAYIAAISDENSAEPSLSGDGKIENGERVRVVLRVQNRGDTTSENTEVNIRGDENEEVFLESARRNVTNLEPKGEALAPMAFRLVKAGEDGKITVGVTVSDRDYGTTFVDTLAFQLGVPYERTEARLPPEFRLKNAPLRTDADRVTLELDVVDDGAVADFFAYVGDKKICYERNRSGGKVFPVRLEVPLKEGSNRLLLAARDQQKIQASKMLTIYRTVTKGDRTLGMK